MMNRTRKKVAFKTFGCKLNFSETSEIGRSLVERGYELTSADEIADFYIIHSCTVTSLAEKKARQAIRHFKKLNPEAKIGVIGCYVQLRGDELIDLPEVDFIADNEEKYNLTEIFERYHSEGEFMGMNIHPGYHSAYSLNDRTRSFLKVQDGCDYFCTYCAVAYARGRSRSDTIEHVLEEAKKIVGNGVKEIVLTGVNVGEFGKGTDETLFGLLTKLENIEGLERIRLSSIEPNLLENRIIDLVSQSQIIMPHFHIPLQSGSDTVLERMKRRYKSDLFKQKVEYIKQQIPDACIAADVIVGFPGESDDEFHETCIFIQSLPLSYLHVFTYSDRPDTLASKMKTKVAPQKKQARSKRLHNISNDIKKIFYKQNEGSTRTALFEEIKEDFIFGWTDNYVRVKTLKNNIEHNVIKTVTLASTDEDGVVTVSIP